MREEPIHMMRRKNFFEPLFENEKFENDKMNITFNLPEGVDPNNVEIKHEKNAYHMKYKTETNEEKDGVSFSSSSYGYFSRSFPFEIKNPHAEVKENKLFFSFDRGEDTYGLKSIPIKNCNSKEKIVTNKKETDSNASCSSGKCQHCGK
ncbi:hypothetical protein CWI39_0060p0020 [Hamiltosporidium magnivora]|uniref:SHSP domain-containing protein n=1 Tax=Hamiltosporidium magnivora TaxID=148818 RepID=A0A4Q9LMH0_9MICR|nr:hypothetical protein CWI39_0060p0020 [Hamiltosporidium magnivora]